MSRTKLQLSKSQNPNKLQIPMTKKGRSPVAIFVWALEFWTWDLFEICCLGFGIFISTLATSATSPQTAKLLASSEAPSTTMLDCTAQDQPG
jgi:hypothetical protein